MATIYWEGLRKFQESLVAKATEVEVAAREAVVEGAAELETLAKENATGRPGPEVQSGALRRGIVSEKAIKTAAGGWATKVGPTMIYSRRVELGYKGTDSLGRVYDQAGYPFFEPAYRILLPRFQHIFATKMNIALRVSF